MIALFGDGVKVGLALDTASLGVQSLQGGLYRLTALDSNGVLSVDGKHVQAVAQDGDGEVLLEAGQPAQPQQQQQDTLPGQAAPAASVRRDLADAHAQLAAIAERGRAAEAAAAVAAKARPDLDKAVAKARAGFKKVKGMPGVTELAFVQSETDASDEDLKIVAPDLFPQK